MSRVRIGMNPPTVYVYPQERGGIPVMAIELTISRAKIGALLRLAAAMADVEHALQVAAPATHDKARAAAEEAARAIIPEPIFVEIQRRGTLQLSADRRDWAVLCLDDVLDLVHGLLLEGEP